jgi:hypothetical protein
MVDVLELLYNSAADKVSPRLMPTQDQRDMVSPLMRSSCFSPIAHHV